MSLDFFLELSGTRRIVIVAGMHRSGTSAIAGILSILGVDFGNNLIPPAKDNPKGFWEDRRIVDVHEELLRGLGRSWDDFRSLPEGWLEFDVTRSAAEKLKGVIESSFSTTSSSILGVKDPRISRFLPLWIELLRELEIFPLVVLCLRSPEAVAESLLSRNKMPESLGQWLWFAYNSDILRDSKGIDRVIVNYESLLEDWRHELSQSLGGELLKEFYEKDKIKEVDEFLVEDLCHHSCLGKGDKEVVELSLLLKKRDWLSAENFIKNIEKIPDEVFNDLIDYQRTKFLLLENELSIVSKDAEHLNNSLAELNSWSRRKDEELGETLEVLALKEKQLEEAVALGFHKEDELNKVLDKLAMKEKQFEESFVYGCQKESELDKALEVQVLRGKQLEEAVAFGVKKKDELNRALEVVALKEKQLEEAVTFGMQKENEIDELLNVLSLKENKIEELVAYSHQKGKELNEMLEKSALKDEQIEVAVLYGRQKENELSEALKKLVVKEEQLEALKAYTHDKEKELSELLEALTLKEEQLRCFEGLKEEIKAYEERVKIIEQGFYNQISILNEESMSFQKWIIFRRIYFWIRGLAKR